MTLMKEDFVHQKRKGFPTIRWGWGEGRRPRGMNEELGKNHGKMGERQYREPRPEVESNSGSYHGKFYFVLF